MSTSITVEFQVNDLDANYEVLGTSDNYSFQEKLGLGSNLVLSEGEAFVKVIPLKGNYGVFDIRVFAVTDIGVRSPSLIGSVEVLPKELENTFTFSEIKITDNRYENLESSITYIPQSPGDKLEVESQFAEKSIKFSWNLIPPDGHPLEGAAVSNQLLNDTFFSGFKINIKNNGQSINLADAGFSNTSLDALANTFETDKENVVDVLQNYRDFYLNFDENVFNDLGLSRNVELEVIAVDRFGREATGTIQATNPEPVISNLTHSLQGSEASFSWTSQDVDFNSVDVNVLAVPEGTVLPFDQDLELNAKYFQSLKQAKPYNKYKGAYYNNGEKVVYGNKVYNCISGHARGFNETPDYSESWELVGGVVDFNYFSSTDDQDKNLIEDVSLSDAVDIENTFNVPQLWGYEYYYTFQPSDGFGEGQIYNFTNRGLVQKGDENSELDPLIVNIKLDNLRFREVKDDLVFNWDVTDQDGNLVDISQYKFLFGNNDTPSLLGISGSLYDMHTRQKITGITDGYNSKGLDFDEDGDLVVNANLPSTKVFDQYKYTRESNNAIYGTGGFPADYQDYDDQAIYNIGDNVLSNNKIYTSNVTNNSYAPTYSTWQESETYFAATSDKFVYKNNVYVTTNDFGADADTTSGLFDETQTYNIGDIVLSPEKNITVFGEQVAYNPGDFVFYDGSIYECLIDISTEEIALIGNTDYWRRSDIFGDIKCSYFKSLTNSNTSYPFSNTSNWEKVNPESLAANGQFFDVFAPAYEFSISDWNSGSKYFSGSFVVYANDIWSGTQSSQGEIPSGTSEYWANNLNGQDFGTGYQVGDLVYSNNFIYQCTQNNPAGGPIVARTNEGDTILSSYQDTNWLPFWELNDQYDDIVFGHVGIPQSGKRSVGIELGIVDKYGKIVNKANLDADNPAPYILTEGFKVDSTSQATKVKFSFNYALGFQEKTTKVYLYRSENPVFDIVDEYGFPLTGEDTPFVKSVVGAGDATFGQNITQIIDEPPISGIDGVDQITGYYYKILPFDDFGSGVLYEATNNDGVLERVIVYPKRYNSPNPDVMPGRVLRADPTESAGAVPGPVIDFSGTTAFENFFLNWKSPGSEYQQGSTTLLKQRPNDIDHYEIWASTGDVLYTGDNQGNLAPWAQDQNTGYRQIEGVMYSVGNIPEEFPDPALKISGAENIFNVPANAPSVETVYPGKTNDTKNFWIRAVDFGGNKSPFTGAALDTSDDILGLSLTLGQASATDVTDFETSLTETFTNTIALNPNNPFSDNGHWQSHKLFYSGIEYDISANSDDISDGYIWWQTGNNNYNTGSIHPANIENNVNFNDGDFVIGRINNLGEVTPAFSVFANALIGTANIADASIVDAKINDLKADKITAGEISSADIQISTAGSEAGVIRSAGFTGIDSNPSRSGFYISGDGTFAFQGGSSSLSFEDDTLTLRGKLRQSSGFDYDFIDLDVTPSYFNYIQASGYEDGQDGVETFIPDDNSPTGLDVIATFRNSSVPSTGVRFRMDVLSGSNRRVVFAYNDYINEGEYNISGFVYDPDAAGAFRDDSVGAETKIASGVFALGSRDDGSIVHGFDYIIDEAFPGSGLADSVILYTSGINSTYEKSVTITRINDGRVGQDGIIGENARTVSLSTNTQAITYDELGSNPNPSSAFNITGTALNTDGTVYYQFIVDGVTEQNETGNTYSYSPPASFSSLPDVVRVNIREGSDSSTVLASDTLTIFGVKPGEDGEDAYTVILTNENHTFSTDKNGNVSSYNGSGTKVIVYNGATELEAVASSPSADQFSISRSVTSGTITAGAVDSNSPDTILQHSNMTTDQAVVTITINIGGTSIVFTRDQTLSKSKQGINGNIGASPTYRGEWTAGETYIFEAGTVDKPGRGDIVKGGNGNYYIALQDSGPPVNDVDPTGTLASTFWKDFGAVFDNVATNILLTEEAYITDKLIIGDYGFSGAIVSNGFTGGLLNVNTEPYQELTTATENYDTQGFLLARTDNSVVFDVGGTGIAGQTGYIRFDSKSGKLQIAGSFINNTVIDESLFYDGSFNSFQDGDNLTSFIGGGYNNTLTGSANNDKFFENLGSAIVGGAWNTMNSRFSMIGAGYENYCADNFSFIGGGYENKMPLEEPGDHQGANFIGCGIDNQVNGGSSQGIVNGVNNTIEGLTGDYIPVFDRDNGLFAKRVLGRTEGGIPYTEIAFDRGNYGWTDVRSGVWFPAGIDSANTTNIQDYYTKRFSSSLYIGELNGISEDGWVFHLNLGWMYLIVDYGSIVYSDDYLNDIYAFIGNNTSSEQWYKFSRNGAGEQYITAKYRSQGSNDWDQYRYFGVEYLGLVSGSLGGTTLSGSNLSQYISNGDQITVGAQNYNVSNIATDGLTLTLDTVLVENYDQVDGFVTKYSDNATNWTSLFNNL